RRVTLLRVVPDARLPGTGPHSKGTSSTLAIEPLQEFLVQPVDASWLQCNIECQEACPVGPNCRGYLNLAAEGRFAEGYILPREAIEMDVRLVERLGVEFRFNTTVGVDVTFEELQRDYDGVALTAGAMDPVALDVPGGDLDGVDYGVDFMKKANLGQELYVGKDVVVIGGGYTAMDCSRTSLRHGAEHVSIVYRRTRSELVVDEEELGETEREGVRMEFLASPIEVLGEDGHVTGVRF